MEANEQNSFDKNLLQRTSIESYFDQFGPSDAWMLCSLKLSLVLETGNMSLFHKSLSSWILGHDSFKGEGCNTPGVCHQLSNGFKLKHDMLSGDEGVKIKSTRVSSNLNLANAPLLTCGPLLRLCKSKVKHVYFMYITSTCIHLDQWKSFMKFGIKKSHEMTSYVLAWIVL